MISAVYSCWCALCGPCDGLYTVCTMQCAKPNVLCTKCTPMHSVRPLWRAITHTSARACGDATVSISPSPSCLNPPTTTPFEPNHLHLPNLQPPPVLDCQYLPLPPVRAAYNKPLPPINLLNLDCKVQSLFAPSILLYYISLLSGI